MIVPGTRHSGARRPASRPARVDSFVGATGPIAREVQALGIRA
jgi:hypothetical protein